MIGDLDRQPADARDEDGADDKEVLVLAEVDVLEHLETADGDEAVESEAHAAHDRCGDGLQKRHDGGEEGEHHAHDGGDQANMVRTEALPVMATQPTDSP